MANKEKLAIVTGGARGIGLGVASALARDGVRLAICGRSAGETTIESIRSLRDLGADVQYFQADISSDDDRSNFVDAVEARMGKIDVLVNNAGVAPEQRVDLLDATEQSYDRVMGINLKGPFFLTQLVARKMAERDQSEGERCIVNVTSISATVASPSRGEYCISKAGLAMMSSLFATRLAEHGINVFEVRPGVIQTDMTAGVVQKYDRLIADGLTLQGRWGYPADVGKAVAALVRGDFPYSTGQVIMVDGGMLVDRL